MLVLIRPVSTASDRQGDAAVRACNWYRPELIIPLVRGLSIGDFAYYTRHRYTRRVRH